MPKPQSATNHASRDLAFMSVLLLAVINVILAITYTIRQWPIHSRSHLWWIVMAIAFVITLFRIRGYATKNQDRIIRLEERLRYATLLAPAQQTRATSLTLRQIISLRFASDAELPSLIDRALAENMTAKQIKQAIKEWKPDYERV